MPKDNQANLDSDDGKESGGTGSEFIQNLMYIYRAYANFVLEDYDLCIKDYLKANSIQKLGALSYYNM